MQKRVVKNSAQQTVQKAQRQKNSHQRDASHNYDFGLSHTEKSFPRFCISLVLYYSTVLSDIGGLDKIPDGYA
jgi:hypothetical protein